MVFCEGKYGGMFRGIASEEGRYFPEYGNAFSAVCIGFSGFHMLLFWDSSSPLLRLVEALFIVNSWSSFMYHYFDKYASVDSDSMVMASLLLFGYVTEEFCRAMALRCYSETFDTRKLQRLGSCFMWATLTSFFWWYLSGANVKTPDENGEENVKREVFEVVFAIPIGLMVIINAVLLMLWRRRWFKNEYIRPQVQAVVLRYFWIGLIMATFAFLCWYFTEDLCGENTFFTIFPGHVIWHVFMPWSCQYMMLLPSILTAEVDRTYPIFKTGLYFRIFPGYDCLRFVKLTELRQTLERDRNLSKASQDALDALPNLVGSRSTSLPKDSDGDAALTVDLERDPMRSDADREEDDVMSI